MDGRIVKKYFMKGFVTPRWWLGLPALFVLFALGFVHANIATAQSFEYRLGPGDKIRVNVFGREDLSGIYKIRSSGFLSLPVAGEIEAADLTLGQLEAEIANRYSVLMKSDSGPDQAINVNIDIVQHRNFYILGDVRRPGGYEYQERLTVLRAVAIAGGYVSSTPDARVGESGAGGNTSALGSDSARQKKLARIRITRETEEGTVSLDADDNTVVLPGDIISVPYRSVEELPMLPDPGQQSRPVKKDKASEAETGAVTTGSQAMPKAEDPSTDYVYTVYLFSTASAEVADQVNEEFQRAGHESSVMVTTGPEGTHYRVGITGFESRQAARQYAESIPATLGITDAWVSRVRSEMALQDN